MSTTASIHLANGVLRATPKGATLVRKDGSEDVLSGVELRVYGDSVELEGKHQKMLFKRSGSGARITDLADPEQPTYNLESDGSFRYNVAGFPVRSRPTLEGTLATPGREVNPLLPLEDVLPRLKTQTEETPRTALPLRWMSNLSKFPKLTSMAATVAGWVALDFTMGVLVGAATYLTLRSLSDISAATTYKPESLRLESRSTVAGGTVEAQVKRAGKPRPGRSRASKFYFDSATMKLANGVRLRQDTEGLTASKAGTSLELEKAHVTLSRGELQVREGNDYTHTFDPAGGLKTVKGDYAYEPSEFVGPYNVMAHQESADPDSRLEFEEDEVVIDEFSVPYDHGL